MTKKIVGFPLFKNAYNHYNIEKNLLDKNGILIFNNHQKIKELVQKINKKRNISIHSEKIVYASEFSGILTVFDAIQQIISKYDRQTNSNLFKNIYENFKLATDINVQDLTKLYKEKYHYLLKELNQEKILYNIFLIWIGNSNKAFQNIFDLIDDETLLKDNLYSDFDNQLSNILDRMPDFDNTGKNLIEFIFEPIIKYPNSIHSQVKFIIKNWDKFLQDKSGLLQSLDFMKENRKIRSHAPGPTKVYQFERDDYDDYFFERFSDDKDWMPEVVLLAKSTYVWLHQLSSKYDKKIKHLSDIPEKELKNIASQGFNSLWLIGIWERSDISRKIKNLCGYHDAIASAYSLKNYNISHKLGGWESYEKFKNKAHKYGIRLAADIVPNHTGLDSDWLLNHPDWFVHRNIPPFSSYTFKGENLSKNPQFEIKIEDGYYHKTDAAVVFKLHNKKNNQSHYIYHGNDGTHLPWNDTAQLNFLKKDVRKSVIEQIVHIAKEFHIIRFDAAMTLAKKHFQRLWFPISGQGGDIPSRFEYCMSKEEFDILFPKEFWLEVVERVEEEAPNCLLLAEAFWMMEGFFVKNLGMHRVYNSAFMNMLKNEENNKYRTTIYNVLEYNPQILKRFVNFMSNPDEETAFHQFGDNDKYFGVTILMSTLPGLPMFAHGQVEGFKEKYGMEYYKPKYNEKVNKDFLERHYKEIFPILKDRKIFSGIDNFYLFDFYMNNSQINGNVFAYINGFNNDFALVLYNNKYQRTEGYINVANYPERIDEDIVWKKYFLHDILKIPDDSNYYLKMKDQTNNQEFLRSCSRIHEKGFEIRLDGYEYNVFRNFEIIEDKNGLYKEIFKIIKNKGVENIDKEIHKIKLRPLHHRFEVIFSKNVFLKLIDIFTSDSVKKNFFYEFNLRFNDYFNFFSEFNNLKTTIKSELILKKLSKMKKIFKKNENSINSNFDELFLLHFFYILLNEKNKLFEEKNISYLMNKLQFENQISKIVSKIIQPEKTSFFIEKLNTLLKIDFELDYTKILNLDLTKKFIYLNEHDNILWYSKERFEILFYNIFLLKLINNLEDKKITINFKNLLLQHNKSEFKFKKLIASLEKIGDKYEY